MNRLLLPQQAWSSKLSARSAELENAGFKPFGSQLAASLEQNSWNLIAGDGSPNRSERPTCFLQVTGSQVTRLIT
jgi:hypothetical protein